MPRPTRRTCGCLILAPLTCLLLCCLAVAVRQQLQWRDHLDEVKAAGDYELSLKVGDDTRHYLLHLPPNYDPSTPLPLVIVLHGGGGNAQITEPLTGMSQKADEEGFIVAYPNGSGRLGDFLLTWNAGNCCAYAQDQNVDDVAFMRTLIETLENELPIDPQRVYVTGISNGGMMSFALACELSNQIAAIGPVVGAFNWEDCQPDQPISVVMFNGKKDQRVPYEGGRVNGRTDTSVAEGVAFWVEHNGCDDTPAHSERENGKVLIDEYRNCRAGTAVTLFTVVEGGHSWYGGTRSIAAKWLDITDGTNQDVSATDELWEFFAAHPKR